MKTFPAYGVDPKALFNALKAAGQPVLEVRYRGPERKTVALACICTEDSADGNAVQSVIAGLSGPKPAFDGVDRHVEALGQGIGQRMQSCLG